MSEHDIQSNFFRLLDISLREEIRGCVFAIPNGGKRHIGVARKMKAEGVKAGVLDVFCVIPARGYHGLFIEFKCGKNTLTKEQKLFAERAKENGYNVFISYDAVKAYEYLAWYLSSLTTAKRGEK